MTNNTVPMAGEGSYEQFAADVSMAYYVRTGYKLDVACSEWESVDGDTADTWTDPVYVSGEWTDSLTPVEMEARGYVADAVLDFRAPNATWEEQVTFAVEQMAEGLTQA